MNRVIYFSTRSDDRPVIVGAGLAGLATALALAPLPCTILSAAPLGDATSTGWAQGGIAAAVAPNDTPALHTADTIAAGDGLCDPDAVARIIQAGPAAIAQLAGYGARFDRAPDGTLLTGLEAAHRRHRIVHATGDGTGREVLRALIEAARNTPSIHILEHTTARHLLRDAEGRIAGIVIEDTRTKARTTLPTSRVVIATGGLGGLYAHTTNPLTSTGTGVALAARAGATLSDLEFVQFHPTAIDAGRDPMPLASEAIRGEGAHLIDETGRRFMLDHAPANGQAELAPRDIVARAIAAHRAAGHSTFLDARTCLGPRFATRFPNIDAICREAGIDPATMPIPIRPAAHYAMGGIATDANGRTDIEGLWAAGEAASTGLHGANRLASNSLLEAAVTAATIAADLAGTQPATRRATPAPTLAPSGTAAAIRPLMSQGFGVVRDEPGMRQAATGLLALEATHTTDPDALLTALLIAASALTRHESRGAHARSDIQTHASTATRTRLTLTAARDLLRPYAPAQQTRRHA
jgi:L-aspartate oxidase